MKQYLRIWHWIFLNNPIVPSLLPKETHLLFCIPTPLPPPVPYQATNSIGEFNPPMWGENKRKFATRKRQLTKTKGKKESQRQKVFCPNPRLVSPFLGIRSSLVALICMPTRLALQLNDCKGRVQKP